MCLSYTFCTSTEEITDLYQNVQSARIKYMYSYIVIEQENYYFNIQIQ